MEVSYQKLHYQNKSREAVIPGAAIEKLIAKLEVPILGEAHENNRSFYPTIAATTQPDHLYSTIHPPITLFM